MTEGMMNIFSQQHSALAALSADRRVLFELALEALRDALYKYSTTTTIAVVKDSLLHTHPHITLLHARRPPATCGATQLGAWLATALN